MSPRHDLQRHGADKDIADHAGIVARYTHLRTVSRSLNQKLVERLSKDVIHEGGERLGILKRGVLVFDSENEASVLMDYCIYDVRRKGCNVVEQYLIDSAPDPESDEMVCLRAMQHARYSLFVVESVVRGVGVTVRHLLSNDTTLVVDIGFASTAQPGVVFASRLIFHEEFAVTGGAALPIGMLPEDRREELVQRMSRAVTPDKDGYFDPAPLIAACLRQGCSSQIQYQEATGRPAGRRRVAQGIPSAKPRRNEPCPCGSGKKFKTCCMKRS